MLGFHQGFRQRYFELKLGFLSISQYHSVTKVHLKRIKFFLLKVNKEASNRSSRAMAMAMQSGIGISKILFIAGAGYTGTVLIKNGKLSDIIGEGAIEVTAFTAEMESEIAEAEEEDGGREGR
ncbi:unnamed protein product [Vicia faba]|uniref:Uncharacterized protein n=1 Tax=Vicia faba TaxID=3906 RepID=A0AAV1A4C2_VICFA|nr:unnamed protein product [Vicia faba]